MQSGREYIGTGEWKEGGSDGGMCLDDVQRSGSLVHTRREGSIDEFVDWADTSER